MEHDPEGGAGADSGFLRGFGDFDLHTVGDGLRSGVTVDDLAERRIVLIWFHRIIG